MCKWSGFGVSVEQPVQFASMVTGDSALHTGLELSETSAWHGRRSGSSEIVEAAYYDGSLP